MEGKKIDGKRNQQADEDKKMKRISILKMIKTKYFFYLKLFKKFST